jgi:hypothetical protein
MLEKVKQLGLEKFAGNEAMASEFVSGFAKAALQKQASFREGMSIDLASGFSGAIGKGLGATAVGLALGGVSGALKNIHTGALHTQYMTALQKAIASNPVLRGEDKNRVIGYADTIFKFAPNVATDSNLLSSILANAIHGEGIDPMTIKTLTELESRYSDQRGNPAFSPKNYV